MTMPVADANGPFIISEITNKLVFRWTIVSSSFQDFAYCGTRELRFSNPVYMDGYLDNQLMFLGWLSHGMAMPVADADGPFIISEITNKLIFGGLLCHRLFKISLTVSLVKSYSPIRPKSFFFYGAVLSIDMFKLLGMV
ncbi:hypothetical protein CASFOL_022478 [Castilleja foliolosa]|uniref:Uncharacterized protein n=1 Tax=Castilleja foliolosa TaxID=1961234 RepID=A0ABD3CY11_9LAMI